MSDLASCVMLIQPLGLSNIPASVSLHTVPEKMSFYRVTTPENNYDEVALCSLLAPLYRQPDYILELLNNILLSNNILLNMLVFLCREFDEKIDTTVMSVR